MTRKYFTQESEGTDAAYWIDHEGASDPHTGYLLESNTIGFLVSTATAELGGEIVVGPTPGGELGGTWASPTVDVTHSGSAHHTQGTDTALGAVGTKNPPIDADKAIYRDSTASDALVTSTWTQVKAFLKTYWDTLYEVVGAVAAHVTAAHKTTRYVWLPPRVFGAMVGTPVLVTYGTATDLADAWAFDVDTTERIGTAFVLPSDWAGGAITVKFYWAADTDTNVAHICTWGAGWSSLSDGDALNLAREVGIQTNFNVPSATVRILDIANLGSSATGLVAGDVIRFYALRNALAVADDMTGDALLLGVLIEYTAVG